ncbi:hypothetical protein CYMTET_20094 [Cymbomonas tetramitiformis]|uniref:Uncharacterized protein n=1 Tax=Cymbomonas tetramitiformis TaxID=36881 RepID=A0AAE0G626_9CHLO|nr:hypothetical protein CYMTET_38509 [Cymbomonas tetramitiformis]KAK3271566.1 hypothetical protein CYMTET_20094 [Cymbomonas tetramitiformis]
MATKRTMPALTKENMDEGDFTTLGNELSSFASAIVFDKNLIRDEELAGDIIDKIKCTLFNYSLSAIFSGTDEACSRVRTFVLAPNSDTKTLPQFVLEETETYTPYTGFVCEPITYARIDNFQVLKGGTVDLDAAWHVSFFLLRLKCADVSAETAQEEIQGM